MFCGKSREHWPGDTSAEPFFLENRAGSFDTPDCPMSHEPIVELKVQNFGCIKDAAFKLSPLHALIGPNDSGKSTALLALRTAAQFAVGFFDQGAPGGNWLPFDPMFVDMQQGGTDILLRYADGKSYRVLTTELNKNASGVPRRVDVCERVRESEAELPPHGRPRLWHDRGILHQPLEDGEFVLKRRITTATMVRFDPDFLRQPGALIPDSQGIAFGDERGTGLASVFDAIVNRDPEAFAQIQSNVRSLFSSVAKVGLINVSTGTKEIAVTLTDGTRVGAKTISEGLLYFLGFAALKYIDGSRLFLVEEPENGLHPARISEVMGILREISKTAQVVIATHSPLVVNELEGNEVSVVTRDPEKGTRAVLLANVPGFTDASKVYRPGEFWVSYADGKQEELLLTGKPRT
jgi:hypothetical protein